MTEEQNPEPEKGTDEVAQTDETKDQLSEVTTQIETLTKERDKAREESKAHQRNVSKREDLLRGYDDKLESLTSKHDILTTMVADIMDRGEDVEEAPSKKRSAEYLSKITEGETKRTEDKRKAEEDIFVKAAQEADTLAQKAGLTIDESPELLKAYNFFLKGNHGKGLEEIRKVVDSKQEVKPGEEDIQKRIDEGVRKAMEEKGVLDVETGGPTAGSDDWGQVMEDYQEGKVTHEKFAEEAKKRGKRIN